MKLTIKDYLEVNVYYHLDRKFSGHSFPCGVWNPTGTYKKYGGDWKSLLEHGQFPRNFILIQIEEVPYGKEITKYDSGHNR